MKKLFWCVLVSVFLFYRFSQVPNQVLTRENKFNIVHKSINATEKNIATYFPFYKYKVYIYKTTDLNSGMVTEAVETYPLYVTDNKMQCITKQANLNELGEKTDSYTFGVLYQNINGCLKCFYSDGLISPLENFTEKKRNQ